MKLAPALLLLSISAFAQPVEIVLATYGAGKLHDVTGVVRNALTSGKRELTVTLEGLGVGDPSPGRVKSLRVVYRVNGSLYEAVANDFESLALPTGEPAAAANAPQAGSAGPGATVQPTTGGFFDTPGSTTPTAAKPDAGGPPIPAATTTPAPAVVSPVASVPNGACFYTQPNYAGTPYCFATGTATAALGEQRRAFRSMRLVGSATAAWLFDADNFTGASVRLTRSQADLRNAQGAYYSTDFEERAASIRVE